MKNLFIVISPFILFIFPLPDQIERSLVISVVSEYIKKGRDQDVISSSFPVAELYSNLKTHFPQQLIPQCLK